jgi:DNA-binding MurR/RpiR family transcriptional regulator
MTKKSTIEMRIHAALPEMPTSQKRIAEHLLENRHLIPLLPIKAVAAAIDVSEASLVRFAKQLGFAGYRELKEDFSASLQRQLSPTEKFAEAAAVGDGRGETAQLVARHVVNNVQETLKYLDHADFNRAVEAIRKAHHIYCFGLELSSLLSQMMTFLLTLYHYPSQHLSNDFLRYKEQMVHMRPDDLLIAFSFSPYSRETVEALAYAKERQMTSIAFTDRKTAPAQEYATISFHIKTDNLMFSNSVGAITVVMNALMAELNLRDRERTLSALKNIEETIRDERYFITD